MLVRFEDVEHHVANGLTPAKARAQLATRHLEAWIASGTVPVIAHAIVEHLRHIEQAIDDTVVRLRALSEPSSVEVCHACGSSRRVRASEQ